MIVNPVEYCQIKQSKTLFVVFFFFNPDWRLIEIDFERYLCYIFRRYEDVRGVYDVWDIVACFRNSSFPYYIALLVCFRFISRANTILI